MRPSAKDAVGQGRELGAGPRGVSGIDFSRDDLPAFPPSASTFPQGSTIMLWPP